MLKKTATILFVLFAVGVGTVARSSDISGGAPVEAGMIILSFHPEYASPTVSFEGACYDPYDEKRMACSAYEWDFGDGGALNNLQNPIHTYASAGTYKVSLTTHDITASTRQSSVYVTVGDSLRKVLMQTKSELDLAINGEGFFQIRMPNGDVAYTRDGWFFEDKDGNFVTRSGYFIEPYITLPPDSLGLAVSESGVVSVKLPNMRQPQEVGRITLTRFPAYRGLESIGDNLFLESALSGAPRDGQPATQGFGSILQFHREVYNADIMRPGIPGVLPVPENAISETNTPAEAGKKEAGAKLDPEYVKALRKYVKTVTYYNRSLSDEQSALIAKSILDYSGKYHIDPRLIVAIIATESSFGPEASDEKNGLYGLMQITKEMAKECGNIDALNIERNIACGVQQIRSLYDADSKKAGYEVSDLIGDYYTGRKRDPAKRGEYTEKVAALYKYFVNGEPVK